MSNAAAVNRILLVNDTPGRATSRQAKIRRYRLALLSLSAGTQPAYATTVKRARA